MLFDLFCYFCTICCFPQGASTKTIGGTKKMGKSFYSILLLSIFFIGCGHSETYKIGLVSLGELEGKVIPENVEGSILTGKDCCKAGSDPYYLSEAVRNAISGTEYDTLIDIDVTSTTGFFVWSNCIQVRGKALNSRALTDSGGLDGDPEMLTDIGGEK